MFYNYMINSATVLPLPVADCYDNCVIMGRVKKLYYKFLPAQQQYTVYDSVINLKNIITSLNREQYCDLSYEYLLALETTVKDASFRYVVIYIADKPVAFCYFQIYSLNSSHFKSSPSDKCYSRIFNIILDLKKIKVLVTGNALRNSSKYFCYDNELIDLKTSNKILISVADKIATDEGAFAAIIRDTELCAQDHRWAYQIGYHQPWNDLTMNMKGIQKWATLQDYVTSLSRKYRARAQKILQLRNDIVIKKLSIEEIKSNNKEIFQLFQKVVNQQDFVLTTLTENHFIDLAYSLGQQFEIIGYLFEGSLVAFHSAYVSKNDYEVYYIGYDSTINSTHSLYFNILFTCLEEAIKGKHTTLKLGRTSFDAKASLGAVAENNNYLIKTSLLHRQLLTWFGKYFNKLEDEKWKTRTPLKNNN